MQNTHNGKITDVTGVLLAGGQSRRMGSDKALEDFNGKPLCAGPRELLKSYFQDVIIAGDRPDLEIQGIKSTPDIFPGSSLGGLHTGLKATKTEWIFVIPCDMPFPDCRLIDLMLEKRSGVQAVVPKTPSGLEPLFALYNISCLATMESMLKNKQFRVQNLLEKLKITTLDWQQMPENWEQGLLNINTLELLNKLRKEIP